MKKLFLFIAALTLCAGLWADNPPEPPTGPITFGNLLFQADGNETVILVEKKDTDSKYSGDIDVPEGFEFTDTQGEFTFRVIGIGANAFKGCSITSVILPASIESIGDNAFANCEQLTSVTCLGTEPAILGTEVFAGDDALTIYVPIWTKDAYEEKWSEYEDIISLTELDQAKENALDAILTARQGIQNTEINMMINDAVNKINSATKEEQIKDAKLDAMTVIGLFQNGKNEAKEELLGDMAEPCTGCTAVEVTDGTTTVTLYNATNVGYIKK